ncbi:hypothetical protein B0H11DRAFT_2292337 [Mycena galericulata]|nr:hypothetical protein B0H11DRAFT_2292337 [Mycena galericulata]
MSSVALPFFRQVAFRKKTACMDEYPPWKLGMDPILHLASSSLQVAVAPVCHLKHDGESLAGAVSYCRLVPRRCLTAEFSLPAIRAETSPPFHPPAISSHKLHTPVAIDFHVNEFSRGVIIPGMVLTGLVLLAFGYTALNLSSRPHLNRVSFRLLVYAMVSNIFYSADFLIHPRGPTPGCTFYAFFSMSSLLFAACMFFCMALNLQLVLVHRVNGQMMEKYYLISSFVLVAVANITALIAGEFGYYAANQGCWFSDLYLATKLRWLVGAQVFWVLAMANLEVVCFIVLVVFMVQRQRAMNDIVRDNTSNSQSLAPIVQHRGMILRIGLYPLLSCFVNFAGSICNLLLLRIPEYSELAWRLNLFTLCVYAFRPLFYACLAATDPSFLRAVRALRPPAADANTENSTSPLSKSWVSSVSLRTSIGTRKKRSFSLDTKALVRVEHERVTDGYNTDRNRDSMATVAATQGTETQEMQTNPCIQIPGASAEEEPAGAEAGGDVEQSPQPRTPEQGSRPTESTLHYVPVPSSDGIECQI